MKTILVDVDTQFDFVDPEGALFVASASVVEAAIISALTRAQTSGQPILGSVDSHSYDAWEFAGNGGPFPPHCVKGTPGWLRVHHELPAKTRFVPMQPLAEDDVSNLVGESVQGEGPRTQSAADIAQEAMAGVGIYFEKEVYSLFDNPVAGPVVDALVQRMGGRDEVQFDVLGYCTGGYCVDAAAVSLAERGYRVRVLALATAAIGGEEGESKSREHLTSLGVEWVAP